MLNSDIVCATSSGQMTDHVIFPVDTSETDETHLLFLELNYLIISWIFWMDKKCHKISMRSQQG